MNTSLPNISLAILCGGESLRMGTSKVLLDFHGEPMVLRMLRRLGLVCGGLHTIVAAGNQPLPDLGPNVCILRDRALGRGPLEGVIVALQSIANAPAESAMAIVSCDLPLLDPALIVAMRKSMHRDSDAIVIEDESRRHPLVGIYRARVLAVAERRLEGENRSLHGLLDTIQTQTVDLDFVRCVDPPVHSLINVNTPDDYERALRAAVQVRRVSE